MEELILGLVAGGLLGWALYALGYANGYSRAKWEEFNR